jgi:hypothetical protein
VYSVYPLITRRQYAFLVVYVLQRQGPRRPKSRNTTQPAHKHSLCAAGKSVPKPLQRHTRNPPNQRPLENKLGCVFPYPLQKTIFPRQGLVTLFALRFVRAKKALKLRRRLVL